MGKVSGAQDAVKEQYVEETKNTWEEIFDKPYEKAGCAVNLLDINVKPPFHWDVSDNDVNLKYKSMVPRFLLEVSSLVDFAYFTLIVMLRNTYIHMFDSLYYLTIPAVWLHIVVLLCSIMLNHLFAYIFLNLVSDFLTSEKLLT